ncbi:MarR family transcriptional regulator [Collimonas arenae]|uniref:MarR family transcriptional regulator n=1 Tax=Collimonas arenae TaxID=279058 RepID=UPI00057118F3|nr:MarR family transcriptional regulator [Collimonas arenae]
MNTEFMLLAIYNKPRLSIDEVCEALGISKATGYTHRSLGKFAVPMAGNPLSADIRDVAEAIDRLREAGKDAAAH